MGEAIDPVLVDFESVKRRDPKFLVYYYLIKALKYSIDKYAKGKLIDIGCGNKPYEKLFQGKIDSYTGCDISQTRLNKVDLICDVTQIPLPDKSFDTAFCTQVIEHVADYPSLVKEAYRLLSPDGFLILSGPLYWPVHGEPYDYLRFTNFGMKYILEKSGFAVVEIIENGGSWATAGQALAHGFEFSKRHSFLFRSLRFIFFRLRFIWLTNTIFKWLDKKDFNPVNTINYVIIAQKKS